jgi:hypothetical protein
MVRFLAWTISAVLKPRAMLVAENLCLRQQLLVLEREDPRPRLRNNDRQFWICSIGDGNVTGEWPLGAG